ncbi:cysteine/serine-rich nuclear protein 1 [Salmo salar]|uniref:Cysteine/serine-rich nuclear protein 1-like n=1 Tax=Salmo salar TaxID=8030 RepID=A0ABM3DJ28_SALSA|nr:cysteine/serine-rich nuclear protein 1-like [Salmo salar]XP_045558815.1 cysteine/serine-rich nuclear protein 1-like [Salmo salar]
MLARAMSGLLKRKFEEVYDEDQCYSSSSSLSSSAYSGWDSEGESCYSDTLDSTPSNPGSPATHYNTKSILKKAKCEQGGRGNVTFDLVTVFLFPRCQGFSSVPSRGGCSLGMTQRHSALRRFTLDEYAVEQRILRREKLLNRLREEKLDALKQKLTKGGTVESEEADRLTVEDIPEDEMDISSCNLDDGSFLHPYPSKRRHALLKASGMKVEKEEKRQLQQLRVSREDCGCDCQVFCEPETCACSLAGIKCQMDHSSFPCGCTKDGCSNHGGRIEFNSSRVQTHYIHTIMKLELEKRLEETSGPEEEDPGETTPCHHYYNNPVSDLPSIPDRPSFHFSSELAAIRENSDTTDSSGGSDYSEEGAELGRRSREDGPLLDDVDENGLSRILSFSDIDDDYNVNNRCCPEQRLQQQPWVMTGFSTADFPEENDNLQVHRDNRAMVISQLLDDNANQGNSLFHHSGFSVPNVPSSSGACPNTPSSSVDCPNTPFSSVECPNTPFSSVDCPNTPFPSVDCPNTPSSSVACPNTPSSSVDCPNTPFSSVECPNTPFSSVECPNTPFSSVDCPNTPFPSVDCPNTPSSSVACPNTPSSSVDCPNTPFSSVECPNTPFSSVDCPNTPSSSVDCPNTPSSSVDCPNTPSSSVDCPNTPFSSVECPNTPFSSVDCPNTPSSSVDCPNTPSSSVDCPNTPSSSVDCPNTPFPSVDGTAASLSSESDLEFFDGFCLGPSALYNSLTEYQHMDNFFHFQLPSYPSSQSQASDPGACLLESLIGLSESVPEPPATFRQSSVGRKPSGV